MGFISIAECVECPLRICPPNVHQTHSLAFVRAFPMAEKNGLRNRAEAVFCRARLRYKFFFPFQTVNFLWTCS